MVEPHMGPEPYRRQERMRAFLHWKESGAPEAKAAWVAEEALLDQHIKMRSILVIAGFIGINGLLFYLFWNHGKKKMPNQTLHATAATPGS
jgi:hypothetical protein